MHLRGSVQDPESRAKRRVQFLGRASQDSGCRWIEGEGLGVVKSNLGRRLLIARQSAIGQPTRETNSTHEDKVRAISMQALETAAAPSSVRELVHGLESEFGHATRLAMVIGCE